MSTAIVGAGAVGAVIAAAASGTGAVTVCVRTPIARLEVLVGDQPSVPGGALRVELLSEPDRVERPVDVVFVAVKATDSVSARPWLERLCSSDTLVVVVQNGLDQVQRFAPLPAAATAVPGLAYLAAERIGPGLVRHLSGRRLVVPSFATGRVQAALPAMAVDGVDDIVSACWDKLLGNLVANPITALTMRRIGVMTEPGIAELARGLLREAVAVGCASGAELADSRVEEVVAAATAWGPGTGSSMLYDRLAGRATEHQFLTGEVVRRGARLGIETPLNSAVLALLEAIDRRREQG